MDSKLTDLIKNARRELRRADGVPMTAEDIEEDRNAQELKYMEEVVYGRIPVGSLFPLEGKVVIFEGKIIGSFSIDERRFRLRRGASGQELLLYAVTDHGEKEIQRLKKDDRQFANRLIVAMADNLSQSA